MEGVISTFIAGLTRITMKCFSDHLVLITLSLHVLTKGNVEVRDRNLQGKAIVRRGTGAHQTDA